VAKHNVNLGHCIQFHDISILAKKSRHVECLTREVIDVELQSGNIIREECFSLSKSWKPLI